MNLESKTDKQLVLMLQKNKEGAFEELVTRYKTKAFNLAMRLTRNQEDAEEVLQDVFTTLYTKIAGFKGESAFSSWLYRIVVNSAFMKLRKRKQHTAVFLEDMSVNARQSCLEKDSYMVERSDSIYISKQLSSSLERAISKLPKQYRAVFLLRDVDGMSNEETSEILNLTVPAVKSRLHRSRLMLRKRLQSVYEEYIAGVLPVTAVDANRQAA
jgi:RNA polymerase sigma-70 factor, ECF subfamily